MFRNAYKVLILASLLVVAACSPTAEATPEPLLEATPAPTDTAIPPTEAPAPALSAPLPDTPVTAVLGVEANTTYKVDMTSFAAMPFEESDLPAAPGSVTAHWYTFAGRYVVAYSGIDLEEAGALCPGNSILTAAGFQHVSNAPTEEGACEGFPTLTTDPDVGPIACQGTLFYVTAIPSELQGTLYGTLEMLTGDGGLSGLTSAVESGSTIPEIDLVAYCE